MVTRIAVLGAAVLADLAVLTVAAIDDLNAFLNVVTIVIALIVAFPVIRSKRKDAVIKEQKEVIESHQQRIEACLADLDGAVSRANDAEVLAARHERDACDWRARYEEQEKYAAPEAFKSIDRHLARIEELLRMWIVKDETSGLPHT